ncbi:uncharacterized protein IL334_006187 [Kwoniella shivajii]|uniref:ABM domain-containing protein n=1 Tax=Kwoniella shivajii TaxID=564305 RepID=A0ABZ1D587_9TREE|nr:hypothetical protein IL334_006187 [Kwoniella shivajii]
MGFIVLIILEVKPEKVEDFKSRLLEAAATYRKDPETVDWTVQQDLENANKFVLIEKYEKESSLTDIHRKNPIYQETMDFIVTSIVGSIEKHFIHT